MMVGLVLVAYSDLVSDDESSESFDHGVLFFMILKIIIAVFRKIYGDFSAILLLLGMDGESGVRSLDDRFLL
jgi:hypothetical protein